jgi:hypothetical protein
MPDYIKRGRWLYGVASRVEDETLSALIEDYAHRMIREGNCGNGATALQTMQITSDTGEPHEYFIC